MEEWADLVDREGAPEDETGPVAMCRASTPTGISDDDNLTITTDADEDGEGQADHGDEDDGEAMDRIMLIARRAGHMRAHK